MPNLDAFLTMIGPEAVGGNLSLAFLGFVKVLYVLAAFLYFLFALVMVRQVRIMGDTLVTGFSPVLRIFALAHLAAAGVVLFLFVTTL